MSSTLLADPLRSLDSALFKGVYQEIGPALSHNAAFIKIYNGTNQSVFISIDGSIDHDFLDVKEHLIIECNSEINPISAGTQFYGKGEASEGNDGLIYLSVYYNVP